MRLLRLTIVTLILATACGSSSDTSAPGVERSRERPAPRTERSSDAPGKVENPAPDVAFQTFEGETFHLSEHRGTPVVLNFWESW